MIVIGMPAAWTVMSVKERLRAPSFRLLLTVRSTLELVREAAGVDGGEGQGVGAVGQ